MAIALVACFAASWTAAKIRRWNADPFRLPVPMERRACAHESAAPAAPPSTGTGEVTFMRG